MHTCSHLFGWVVSPMSSDHKTPSLIWEAVLDLSCVRNILLLLNLSSSSYICQLCLGLQCLATPT